MVNDMTLGTKKNKDSKFNKVIPINKLRNIGFIAHIDAGKLQLQKGFFFSQGELIK